MVVLVGGQAVGKSQFGRALAGEWFAETPFALGDKDAYLNLEGVWIYELAELSATRRSDVESVKAFISGRRDKLRRPYDRMPTTIERQCVFLGSTNDEQFLTDPTGNRRFWPVTCRAHRDTTWARITELASVRDQVWAEVLTAYRAGERWILPERAEAELDEAHLEYQQQHPWKERVAEWLASPAGVMLARKGFLVTHVLDHLEVPMHQRARHHSVQVCEVLRGLGCDRRTVRDGDEVSKRWFLRGAE
jgi:predicted P-loop ATPase